MYDSFHSFTTRIAIDEEKSRSKSMLKGMHPSNSQAQKLCLQPKLFFWPFLIFFLSQVAFVTSYEIEIANGAFKSTMLRSSLMDIQDKASFRLLQENATLGLDVDSSTETQSKIPFAVQIILIIILVLMSGLFSGLTLGLMSLDCTGLEIVMEGDDPVAEKNARAIYPIRSNGNLLLTTL